MKKFLLCLFILALFSGFVFYFGWTQFRVKPEEIGVVISKTSGIDDVPVENGKFSWHWQFLLPTNAVLKTFKIEPLNVTKNLKGSLPSGKFYASYNSEDTFSYEFEFSLSLTTSPQAIVELLKLNQITNNDDLNEFLSRTADSIAQNAADYYLKKVQENPKFRLESVRRDDLLKSIQIYKENKFVDLLNFSLVSSKVPDFELYDKLKSSFFDNMTNISIQNNQNTKNDIKKDGTSESMNANQTEPDAQTSQ